MLSPLLSNIYLQELDKFVTQTLKSEFDCPAKQYRTSEYSALSRKVQALKKLINKTEGKQRQQYIEDYKCTRATLLKTPHKSQTDKKLKYVRYCDDFLVGICGSREDCLWIKRRLSEFACSFLKMELSSEKTLITHSSQYARFLSYDVRVRRDDTIAPKGLNHCTKRNFMNIVDLSIPLDDKIREFIMSKGVAIIENADCVISVV